MGTFKNEDEVYTYIGGIFEDAVADDELGPRFADSGVVLRLNYSDPDATVLVDMPSRKVLTGPEAASGDPTVELWMTSEVGNRFWLGDVNISIALAKGDMRAKGPVPKILKLVPMAKELFPRYRERLEEDSRDDLLAG